MISSHSFVVVDIIELVEVVVDGHEIKEDEIRQIVVQLLQLLHAVVVTRRRLINILRRFE